MMVLLILVHSLLEYPLWYAYFLLPAAWAWGFALGTPGRARGAARSADAPSRSASPSTSHSPWLAVGSVAIVVGSVLSVFDYLRVAVIFNSGDSARPLAQRIEAGRRSLLFSHHADYAAVTSGGPLSDGAASFASTTHYLLDTRLMVAWAEWLAAQGELDKARHLAERLREFHSTDNDDFFVPCPERALPAAPVEAPASAASSAAPFQCQLPLRPPDWREFARREPAHLPAR